MIREVIYIPEYTTVLSALNILRENKSSFACVIDENGGIEGVVTIKDVLSEFVGDTPWAHLDIAGTAYGDGKLPYQRKGAYGFPTRMLIHWVRSRAG